MTENSEDSNILSSKRKGDDKQSRVKGSDTSLTASYPSSSSATPTVSKVARQPSTAAQAVVFPLLPAAAAAASSAVPRSEKKPRSAGSREQFLQKLRLMLDRESQTDSAIVQWSTDGNSFIVMDQSQFEEHTIPTYFDTPIVFASFVRKLNRWGFKRVPSSRAWYFEFCSSDFSKLGTDSAAAVSATSGSARRDSSIANPAAVQTEQTQASPLHQVATQTNYSSPPNSVPSQAVAVTALLSNIQHSNQQIAASSQQQQSINTNSSILQGNAYGVQSTHQWQHHLANTAGGEMRSSPSSQSCINALMSLSGMILAQPTSHNASNATVPQVVQSLLMLMHQIGEEERQRRALADALLDTVMISIGRILGQRVEVMAQEVRQRWVLELLGQTLVGRTANNYGAVQNQQGLDVAPQQGDETRLEQDAHAQQNDGQRDDKVDDDEDDDENYDDDDDMQRPHSPGKRKKSSDDDELDQYYADDDSWNERLRPRKK